MTEPTVPGNAEQPEVTAQPEVAAAEPSNRRRDWRYWVGGTGRVLLVIGALMFGFLAYQLWGTGIEYRQSQDDLAQEFEQRQVSLSTDPALTIDSAPVTEAFPTTTPAATSGSSGPTMPTTPDSTGTSATPGSTPGNSSTNGTSGTRPKRWPSLAKGDALAIIEMPTLGKRVYAVAGVAPKDLKRGLGHYPGTPMPGQLGNSAFAGHRTTYGAPLFNIDKLRVGDEIIVRTLLREQFVYVVSEPPRVINSQDSSVIATTDRSVASLTLTSCHPKYSAKQRIVVTAVLDPAQSGVVQEATPEVDPPAPSDAPEPAPDGGATEPGADDTGVIDTGASSSGSGGGSAIVAPDDAAVSGDTAVDATSDVAGTEDSPDAENTDDAEAPVIGQTPGLSGGWFSDTSAWWDVALWALLDLAIVIAGWLLARRTQRRWLGVVVAAVPFLLVLYFVYQNVNRLLPSDL